jgi:cytoskeletal protein CcmA (bactofilin family)
MFVKDEKTIGESDVVGYIGKGMLMEGKLSFESTVRIDGGFKGEICSRGMLVVGEGALIEAEVKVDTIIVTGEVRGVIEAAKRVELQAPGKIVGEVRTPNLIIGDGGILEGNCTMTKKEGIPASGALAYGKEETKH